MSEFYFKQFSVRQLKSPMKVGTDAMLLGSIATHGNARQILDVGSGTGVIALMMAQKHPDALVHGIELDPDAAEEGRINMDASPWSERMKQHCGDFLDWNCAGLFDLIVSNPPYFQTTKENENERLARARHIGRLTPQAFFSTVAALLESTGSAWLILPAEDQFSWVEAAAAEGLYPNRLVQIHGKRDVSPRRLVISFSFAGQSPVVSAMTIREPDGSYTAEYIELTADFHGTDLKR